jgi:hypothetical protein
VEVLRSRDRSGGDYDDDDVYDDDDDDIYIYVGILKQSLVYFLSFLSYTHYINNDDDDDVAICCYFAVSSLSLNSYEFLRSSSSCQDPTALQLFECSADAFDLFVDSLRLVKERERGHDVKIEQKRKMKKRNSYRLQLTSTHMCTYMQYIYRFLFALIRSYRQFARSMIG